MLESGAAYAFYAGRRYAYILLTLDVRNYRCKVFVWLLVFLCGCGAVRGASHNDNPTQAVTVSD